MKEYNPITGLTIKEAFVKAVLLARNSNTLVHALVNDIHMYITPKADLDKTIKLYHYKKDMEYKIKMGLVKGYNR
ncbi:MAG: hypothetical protein IJ880_11750 [Bacilli bacterium]|nr:hypothetical protein [Bacilli bacterium]